MHARLLPTEKASLEQRPTENADAYVAYVQAHHLQIGRVDFLRLAEERYDLLAGKRANAEKEKTNE